MRALRVLAPVAYTARACARAAIRARPRAPHRRAHVRTWPARRAPCVAPPDPRHVGAIVVRLEPTPDADAVALQMHMLRVLAWAVHRALGAPPPARRGRARPRAFFPSVRPPFFLSALPPFFLPVRPPA
ncbi:hypothetical protein FB451DRAFT_1387285 [Mycena latifolia]|nr:hypothetical protein FB451DRAFT_1387285 [Mycena latifolia]